jgi:mRNA interferase RelE/StbE
MVKHTRTFYRELARLPGRIRARVEEIAFGEAIREDPFLGERVEKLKGYRDYYKIRVGVYRVGLFIDKANRIIEFRRVLHRRDIYRYFP